MKRENETYIGDGVYASFDGYQIWLRTPREQGDHEIALDPRTLQNFLHFSLEVKRGDVVPVA